MSGKLAAVIITQAILAGYLMWIIATIAPVEPPNTLINCFAAAVILGLFSMMLGGIVSLTIDDINEYRKRSNHESSNV